MLYFTNAKHILAQYNVFPSQLKYFSVDNHRTIPCILQSIQAEEALTVTTDNLTNLFTDNQFWHTVNHSHRSRCHLFTAFLVWFHTLFSVTAKINKLQTYVNMKYVQIS